MPNYALPSVRSHIPLLGRTASVRLALLPLGLDIEPVDQILCLGGSIATVTVVAAAAAAESFTVVITTTDIIPGTYTYTFAANTLNTKKEIAYNLFKLINAGTNSHGCTAQLLRLSGTNNWAIDIHKPVGAVFTLANTGTTTTTSLTVSAVTNGAVGAAKNAVTLAVLNPLLGGIEAGQYLQAVQPDGSEKLFRLSATAIAGDTTLTIQPLPEGIAVGSTVTYPVELYDRTKADTSTSFNIAKYSTFNTDGKEDGVSTTASTTAALDGNFYEFCAGYNTLVFAAAQGRRVWLIIQDPPTKANYTQRQEKGAAILSSRSKARPNNGFVTNNFAVQFGANIVEVPSVPIA